LNAIAVRIAPPTKFKTGFLPACALLDRRKARHSAGIDGRLCTLAKWDDVYFPNRLLKKRFGNDSDVPRIFFLNLICASRPHAQGEYLVFDMENFKAREKAVVLVSAKEIVQPSLNSLLLDLLQFELVHYQTKTWPSPEKFLSYAANISAMQ
jgi:hypothetical protein